MRSDAISGLFSADAQIRVVFLGRRLQIFLYRSNASVDTVANRLKNSLLYKWLDAMSWIYGNKFPGVFMHICVCFFLRQFSRQMIEIIAILGINLVQSTYIGISLSVLVYFITNLALVIYGEAGSQFTPCLWTSSRRGIKHGRKSHFTR